MNCKQGDMAIIVRTISWYSHYLGRIVTCEKYYDHSEGPAWFVSPPVYDERGEEAVVGDIGLRPIRPSDEEDEMLRITGKSQKQKKPIFGRN